MPRDEQSANACPNCKKILKSSRGLAVHLRFSNYCQLYRRARLQELRVHHDGASQEEEDIVIQDEETPERLQQHSLNREDSPEDVAADFHDRLFDFHPLDEPNGDHDSGVWVTYNYHRRCSLQDLARPNIDEEVIQEDLEEDMRVEEDIYPTAARILRTDETLHEGWRRAFGGEGASDLRFAPFNSEVDWRFAEWAIKSGVGHKQLDRLLGIPGVSRIPFSCH